MRKLVGLLLLFIVVWSTGCPKYTPKNNSVLLRAINSSVAEVEDKMAQYNCAAESRAYFGVTKNNRNCPAGTSTKEDAKRLRNAIIARLNYMTDMNYNEFVIDLRARRSTTNLLADATELGAGFAAAITNGERAIQIIATALNAFKGGRKAVELNYYRERTTDLLINQMDTSRAKAMTTIETQIKESVDDYPLEAGLGDLIDYFYAGTLDRGLRDLQQTTGLNAQVAQNNLLRAKNPTLSPIPNQALADDNKASKNKLEDLENDFDAGGALQTAAVIKMRQALTALSQNAAAKTVIDATLNGTAAADTIDTLDQTKVLSALLGILALAKADEKLAADIKKALKA